MSETRRWPQCRRKIWWILDDSTGSPLALRLDMAITRFRSASRKIAVMVGGKVSFVSRSRPARPQPTGHARIAQSARFHGWNNHA